MQRPKLEIEKEGLDKLLEYIGLLGLIVLIALPLYYYGSLPDTIPSHFGSDGTPDDWSGKGMIWLLPGIGVIMYIGLTILNRFPHTFNYLKQITQENAYYQYKLATRLIRFINTFISCSFAYITWVTIQSAEDNSEGFGELFLPIFLGGIFLVIAYYFYMALKKT